MSDSCFRIRWLGLAFGLLLAHVTFSFLMGEPDLYGTEPKNRFFEQRVYITHPGKLAALNARFRDHTNRLFKKHGMELVGYWTPTDGDAAQNTLIYILAYPSREARDASWAAFRDDAEWKKVFEESHRDGPIVQKVESTFMTPTDYSPVK